MLWSLVSIQENILGRQSDLLCGKQEKEIPMTTFSHALREEHQQQVTRLEGLRGVADSIGSTPRESLREEVGQAYHFLTQQLLPHAQAEEQIVYPVVGRLLGVQETTATMTRDHLEVLQFTEELEAQWLHLYYAPLNGSDEQALRRILYSLYAILKLHLAKEEELYLPLLETRLPAEEGSHLVEAMKHAAMEAQRRLKTRSPHEEPPSVSFPNANRLLKTDGAPPFPSAQ